MNTESTAPRLEQCSKVRLLPTGMPPLEFEGAMVAQAGSPDEKAGRWHHIELYRAVVGSYVVAVGYVSEWDGEGDQLTAIPAADIEGVWRALRAYDPTRDVIGYPAGEQWTGRQRRLLETTKRRYSELVGEVLGKAPGATVGIEQFERLKDAAGTAKAEAEFQKGENA